MSKGRQKRLINLSDEIMEVIGSHKMSTNQIKNNLLKVRDDSLTWGTVKSYLQILEEKGILKSEEMGDPTKPVVIWCKR